MVKTPSTSSWLVTSVALLASTYLLLGVTVAASALDLAVLRPWPARGAWCLTIVTTLLLTSHFAMRTPVASNVPKGALALEWAGAALWFLGCAVTLWSAYVALALPVGAYDALGYRLPAMAQWLDAGRLAWVTSDDALRNGYALGLEVLMALVTAATGSTALVDALALLFVVAGACALGALAHALQWPRGAARMAAGVFLLVPMHVLNATSGYADAAFAGAVCAALALTALWTFDLVSPALGLLSTGTACGWMIALKPHGIAFAALIIFGSLLVRWRKQPRLTTLRHAALLALACVPGAFFTLRNILRTGNPIYPVEVRIAGRVWLHGEGSLSDVLSSASNLPTALQSLPAWVRPLRVWLQLDGPAVDFDDRLAGLGYAFVLFAIPATTWALTPARLRRESFGPFAWLCLMTGLLMCLQPLTFWTRYTSWLWAAGALAVALVASRLRPTALVTPMLLSLVVIVASLEGLYAAAHEKRVDRLGPAVFSASPITALAATARLDRQFIQDVLVGRKDVCRTPWTRGTDDANLDGIVAQLVPRPRMHIVQSTDLRKAVVEATSVGCGALIAIGSTSLTSAAMSQGLAVEKRTAWGTCYLISLSSTERSL